MRPQPIWRNRVEHSATARDLEAQEALWNEVKREERRSQS